MRKLLATLFVCSFVPAATAQENVLLVVLDDVGLDNVGAYGVNPAAAPTPNMDALAQSGVLFRRAYSNPVCSATRATILTGRYAWRTGLGAAVTVGSGDSLALSTPTIANVMKGAGYGTAAVGKWHLADGDPLHALSAGFDQHWGSKANIVNYFLYPKLVNGIVQDSTVYATTDTVDDALNLMGQMAGNPWFLWVAFNSAHAPFHAPPAALHTYTLPAQVAGNEAVHTKAMIEAMDAELGRLLAAVNLETTLVIVVGDNGPDSLSVTPPWNPLHAKHTVFDLGIHVALIVAGAGTQQGAESSALVNTTDLYATIAELAGVPATAAVDSVSLWPYLLNPSLPTLRDHAYSERFKNIFDPAAGWPGTFKIRMQAAIGQRYKLKLGYLPLSTQVLPAERQLFDLVADPFETVNLLDQPLTPTAAAVYTELRTYLVSQGPSPWTNLGGAVPGAVGPPLLEGEGPLVPGTTTTVRISNGHPSAKATLSIGYAQGNQPVLCGTLVPTSDITLPLVLDDTGARSTTFVWPQLAGSAPLYMQAWIMDSGSSCGFAATNALVGTTAP